MDAGMKNGEMRRGPPLISSMCSRSIVENPPMPEAMKTPTWSAFSGVTSSLRVLDRELRRRHRELDEDVDLLDVLLLEVVQGIEALDLAGDPRREVRGVEVRDRARCRRRPAHSAVQFASVPMPTDESRPTPVTTTRLFTRASATSSWRAPRCTRWLPSRG